MRVDESIIEMLFWISIALSMLSILSFLTKKSRGKRRR